MQRLKCQLYLQKHIPVQRVTGEEILVVTNARAESLRASPVLYEFSVVKNNDPASGMQRERTLVLTKEFMAEMTGSHVIALHSLSDILGLVVSDKNESEVIVELSGWRATQYCVADREALVGSLAEVASHAKARNFSVRLEPFAQHTLPEKPLPLYQNEYEIYLIARFMTVFLAHRENLSGLTQADVVAEWLPMVKEYACNMHPGDSLCIDARPMLAVAEMLRASLGECVCAGMVRGVCFQSVFCRGAEQGCCGGGGMAQWEARVREGVCSGKLEPWASLLPVVAAHGEGVRLQHAPGRLPLHRRAPHACCRRDAPSQPG
ncbi:unnamed protein product [Closterium sp. NIES-54]